MSLVYVKLNFYQDNNNLKEIVFPDADGDDRPYYFLSLTYKNNNIFVPLRSNLDNVNMGIGYPVPSASKLNAGFDYRKIIIINNLKYIDTQTIVQISSAQERTIETYTNAIESESIAYIKGYENSYKKGRVQRDFKYKYSTLCNYHKELGL